MIKLTETPILTNCQVPNGFFGITVTFIIQKFFEVTRENILHIFRALVNFRFDFLNQTLFGMCAPKLYASIKQKNVNILRKLYRLLINTIIS